MSDIPGTVERYITLWNETDAAARKQGIAEIFAEGATYTDPLADVAGHDQHRSSAAPTPHASASDQRARNPSAAHHLTH